MDLFVALMLLCSLFRLTASDSFDHGRTVAYVQDYRRNAISGIAVSHGFQYTVYLMQDSRGTNELFIRELREGDINFVLHIEGAANCDWEDLAIGPGPSGHWIYIGDIGSDRVGDEDEETECNTIYKVFEPRYKVMGDQTLKVDSAIKFSWPEENGETLMVDPHGDLYILGKTSPDKPVMSYKIPRSAWGNEERLNLTGTGVPVNVTLEYGTKGPTSGDISPKGNEILIRTYGHIYLYKVEEGQDIQEALQGNPESLYHQKEERGEAIAWDSYARSFYTTSEGVYKDIYQYHRVPSPAPPPVDEALTMHTVSETCVLFCTVFTVLMTAVIYKLPTLYLCIFLLISILLFVSKFLP